MLGGGASDLGNPCLYFRQRNDLGLETHRFFGQGLLNRKLVLVPRNDDPYTKMAKHDICKVGLLRRQDADLLARAEAGAATFDDFG